MKSAVLQLASDFKIDIGLQSSNTSRLISPTKSNINVVMLEATLQNTTLDLNELIKNQVEEQEYVKMQQQTVPLNTVNVELQEANDKPDLKNIKEEIRTELGTIQELQSVAKGKGKGKGQSNFKKGKISRQKHISEDKPEEIKQEPRWKEENKKISRQALKKWKERTRQLRVRKSVRVGLSRNQSYQMQLVQLGLN